MKFYVLYLVRNTAAAAFCPTEAIFYHLAKLIA